MPASASVRSKAAVTIGVIGERADLTYDYTYLGAGPDSLAKLAEHAPAKAQKPMFIIGQGALARADGAAILALAAKAAAAMGVVKDGWNGFNILHTAAGRVGALDVCALPGDGGLKANDMIAAAGKGNMDVLFLAGADEIDTNALGTTFVVYIGTHGDAGAHRADVILPGAAYTEKSATYVNTEGRPQMTARATFPPGDARDDWSIISALAEQLGVQAGLEQSRPACAPPCTPSRHSLRPLTAFTVQMLPRCRNWQQARGNVERRLRFAHQGFLFHQPDCACLAHHG